MRVYLFIAALCVLVASVGTAQETTTGSIAGRVIDQQGLPVPGATVAVVSGRGTTSLVTGQDGRFLAPFLVPGPHSVRVQLQGFRTVEQSQIDVRLGQRVDVTITLEVGLETNIVVEGATPLVDVTSTTVGTNIRGTELSTIPLSRRFTDVLYVAPGVSSSGGLGQANASIAGASGLENLYSVDGVNITNTGFGGVGSFSSTFGSLGTGIPYDFIAEVQVKTGGASAEYGEATGGIVNVITRSGTNTLKGSAFAYTQPEALAGTWKAITFDEGFVNTTGTRTVDAGFVLGGPLRRDRLFYFAAVNPAWDRQILIAPEGFPLRSLGEVPRDRRTVSYAGKVSYQLTAAQRLEASFFGDPSHGAAGPQRGQSALLRVDTAGFSEVKYGGNQQVGRYTWVIGANWFLEASVARSANSTEELPVINEWSVSDLRVTPTVRSGGIGTYNKGNFGSNVQYSAKLTNTLGAHQLRYGVLFEDIRFDENSAVTGPQITLIDGRRTETGASVQIRPDPVFGQIYRVTYATLGGANRQTKQKYFNFFVDDVWKISDKLTVQAGLRYEQQNLVGRQNSYLFNNNWAPRIGVTFDPTGVARAKIYAHWGRYFNKLPNNTAARSLTAIPDLRLADYYDAGLTQPVPNGVLAAGTTVHLRTASGSASEVQPGTKEGYQDEFIVGTDYEISAGFSLGVRYTRRDLRRIFEDIANAACVLYFMPEADLSSVTYFLGNPSDGYPPTLDGIGSFETGIRTYNAVELTVNKRFSNKWSLIGSYRWSRLYGTFEGFYSNDTGEANPGLTEAYDFPQNDPTYTEIGVPEFGFKGDIRYLGHLGAGLLANDRRHQVKLFGNYTFDRGVNFGVGFQVGSGRPLTPFAAHPVYGGAGIPEAPHGSGIPTADGFKKRTPVQVNLDVNASYWLKLGGARRLGLLADVFNLFNMTRAIDYGQNDDLDFQVSNPDYGKVNSYQTPLRVRLGVRFEF
jgi:hypothetical protein